MQINIPQILEDLSLVKKLLESFLQDGTLAISEEKLIVDFFIHYQSTNELVSNAIEQIRSKAEGALDEFTELQHEMEAFLVFYSNNEKDFNTIDFKGDCNKYLEQFDNAYKSASTVDSVAHVQEEPVTAEDELLKEESDNEDRV